MRLSPAQVVAPTAAAEPDRTADGAEPPTSYLELYGLAKPPFGSAADPAPFVRFPSQRLVFEALVGTLRQGRGHVLLMGEPGVGKSSLFAAALDMLPDKSRGIFRVARHRPGPLTRGRVIAQLLDIAEPESVSPELLAKARAAVSPRPGNERPAILAIDDAQFLTADALDWLMRIAGGRSAAMPQVLLCGRPELRKLLEQKQCKPFVDRIARTLELGPLRSAEMEQYIERRLWMAGSSVRRLMSGTALRSAIRQAGGYPGRIDPLLEGALGTGFLRGEQYLSARTIRSAAGRQPVRRRRPIDPGRALTLTAVIVLLIGLVAFSFRAMLGS